MPDTTMRNFATLTKLGEKASVKHSEEEKKAAFDRGVAAAKKYIAGGMPISLQDEFGLFMSDLQVSENMGWNSQCFSDENKALIEKRKLG